MNQTMKKTDQPTTNSDSLFGMALAQAFTAVVWGPAADLIWEAAEIASTVRADRMPKPANDPGYKLGKRGTLTADFTRPSLDKTPDAAPSWEQRIMKPSTLKM